MVVFGDKSYLDTPVLLIHSSNKYALQKKRLILLILSYLLSYGLAFLLLLID